MEIDMMRIDPGAIGFTSGFSQEHKYATVGEQITVKQLIEKRIIMRLSRYDHGYRHHVQDNRSKRFCIYYYYSTHRPLSNMHIEY